MSEEKKILFIKKGSISTRDKAKLTKEGILVVMSSVDDPIIIQKAETPHLVYVTCYTCGERVYMTEERRDALYNGCQGYSCSYGHSSKFTPKKPTT